MKPFFKTTLIVMVLAIVGTALCACVNSNSNPNATSHSNPPSNANQSQAQAGKPSLTALDVSHVGHIKQIATNGDKLLVINHNNELWQMGDTKPLVQGVSDVVAPVAGFDKIAFANTDGYFHLIQNGKAYASDVRLSPHSTMLVLSLAVIAVMDDGGVPSLVRLEVVDDKVQAVAKFAPVLPDARPVQVNFTGDNKNGHIAVLSHPDNTTYQHGVLGDAVEAGRLEFLERHSLTPLAKPLGVDGLVFEANTVAILPHDKGNYLIATMAGGGNGAKTVMVGNDNDKLTIIAQSTALPSNRWQSPFVFNNKLYAIQMPHLVGRLVEYVKTDKGLGEQAFGDGYSNHALGDFETNLVASTDRFAIIPHKGYRTLSLLDTQNTLTPLNQTLPAPIVKTLTSGQKVYLLLADGGVWQIH